MKTFALIATSLTLLATPVLAQNTMTNGNTTATTTTTGTAPANAKFATVAKGEMFTSKLKGLNVYNAQNESIGEITDVAFKGKEVNALILSVGGFLGMGERYVAVSPDSVNINYDTKADKWTAMMNTTKDSLKSAPEFKYPK